MAFTTGAALLQWTADTLKVAVADLPELWTRNADAAVQTAYEKLLAVLGKSSYSGTQISTSDQVEMWNNAQGLFELSAFAKGWGDYDDSAFTRYDVCTELTEMLKSGGFALTKDGEPIAPDSTSAVGGIRYGNASGSLTAQQARCRFFRGDPWGYRGY